MPVSKHRRRKRKTGKGQQAKARPRTSITGSPGTEADFEARLAAALTQAFPFLPPGSVHHQLRFSVRLGRKELEIDGSAGATALGRLDILLTHEGRPIAVLELKRPGQPLEDEDRRQGLSYARLIEPMAPLVLVSNGAETRFFQTHDGAAWQPAGEAAVGLQRLIDNAARIAAQELQEAIATLLGPNSGAARDIVRNLSVGAIRQLSGDWNESLLPFGDGLMFPRKAVMQIVRHLDQGGRSVLVYGPPLIGKSNVLKQLALGYLVRTDAVVLFVNGGAARQGLFRLVADALSVELGWNIGQDDARQWLRDLSHRGPFRVILAIDDGDPDLMGAEIDALASDAFGKRVQLVITCSTGTLEKFTKSRHGRQFTPFGRDAAELELGLLDDDEFRLAVNVLDGFRITFMSGSARSPEYRNPWILRAIAADITVHPNHNDETLAAGIPSLPGLKLMEFARSRFQDHDRLWEGYVAFAQALLQDVTTPDTAFTTGLISAFICRRETLSRHLSEPEFQDAVSRGELKAELLPGDVRVVVAQIPELAALTIARQLRNRVLKDVDADPDASAKSLVNACNRMPLGDVIGAFALAEAATERGGLPIATLTALLQQQPRKEGFAPGAQLRAILDDRWVDIDVGAEGELFLITPKGERHRLETEGDEGMIADTTAWMILSYFTAMPIQVIDRDAAAPLGWIDTNILETVAVSPFILRNPVPGMMQAVRTHPTKPTGTVVCHREGVIEPVTLALFLAAAHDRRRGDYLTEAAIDSKSPAFLMRMYIALRMVAELVDEERRQWATDAAEKLLPQLSSINLYH